MLSSLARTYFLSPSRLGWHLLEQSNDISIHEFDIFQGPGCSSSWLTWSLPAERTRMRLSSRPVKIAARISSTPLIRRAKQLPDCLFISIKTWRQLGYWFRPLITRQAEPMSSINGTRENKLARRWTSTTGYRQSNLFSGLRMNLICLFDFISAALLGLK